MAYVAVKDGKQTIEESLRQLKYERIKKSAGAGVGQIEQGMWLLMDQVMGGGSLYALSLATLVIKQGEGSMEEAAFLLRNYRPTLPHRYYSYIIGSREVKVERKISVVLKDIPQGQLLDMNYDYVHRLFDFDLLQEREEKPKQYMEAFLNEECTKGRTDLRPPRASGYLHREGLLPPVENDNRAPKDTTKQMLGFLIQHNEHLQILDRGMTQAVIALGYASLHGYSAVHPTVGELRAGQLPISVPDPLQPRREGGPYYIGEIKVTGVESLIPVTIIDPGGEREPEFKVGYGVTMGQNGTKAIAMSTLDTCLEGEDKGSAISDEESVLYHIDTVEATGSISHLRLPHYVTFQPKLSSTRETKKKQADDEKGI